MNDVNGTQIHKRLSGWWASFGTGRKSTVFGTGAVLVFAFAAAQGCGDDTEPATGATGGTTATGGAAQTGGMGTTGGAAATGGDSQSPTYAYSACEFAERVGGFTIVLADEGTTVNGKITDSVEPGRIPEIVTADGECKLVQGRNLFCDPECAVGEVCKADESGCQSAPAIQSAGEVSIAGLADMVAVSPRMPKNNYVFPVLSEPAFAEGEGITLTAAGAETVPALSLFTQGIAPLKTNETELTIESGQAAHLTWDAPATGGHSRVRAELNLSLHGGDPVRIECDAEDDGSLEISAALITELLGYAYGGFPAITLTRQSSDSVQVPGGCADFRVTSTVSRLHVEVPGLISCNTSTPCPDGMTCQENAACE